MASELRLTAALLAALLASGGCARRAPLGPTGLLFSYATRPLTTNFNRTPVVDREKNAGSVFQLEYQYFRLQWGDNSIGGLGEEAGFDEVYYADILTVSVWSYFKMERVKVYGHRKDSSAPEPPPARDVESEPEPEP